MPARFYVAKRSLMGATDVIVGKREFEAKCLKGVYDQLTQGIDWNHFATAKEARDWVQDNEIPQKDRTVAPKTKTIAKPMLLQLTIGLFFLIAVTLVFSTLQQWYWDNCRTGWDFWNTGYNLLFSPTCSYYQQAIVYLNEWFIKVVLAFLSSFSVFLYPIFLNAWRQWLPFDDKLLTDHMGD